MKYNITLTLTRPMLGTNPIDPNILDKHIIEKQRELILKNSKINKAVNKYLDDHGISDTRKQEEIDLLFDYISDITDKKLTKKEKEDVLKNGLGALKESLVEHEMKSTTVFLRTKDGKPCIGDHMIYGFLKAASDAICRTKAREQATMLASSSYTCSIINQHLRCQERFIKFDKPVLAQDGDTLYLQRSLRAKTAQGPRITLTKSEQIPEGAKLKFTLLVMDNSPLSLPILREMLDYGQFSGLGQWRNAGYGMFTYEIKKSS